MNVSPGTLIYHFAIAIALQAMAAAAFFEWRRTGDPLRRPAAWALTGLVVMRLLLLIGESLADDPTLPVAGAPLVGALGAISLLVLGWVFVAPLMGQRVGGFYLLGGICLVLLGVVLFLPQWRDALARFPGQPYTRFWQWPLWCGVGAVLALTPTPFMLGHSWWKLRRTAVIGFALLGLGSVVSCVGSLYGVLVAPDAGAQALSWLGRWIALLGYAALAAQDYAAPPGKGAAGRIRRDESAEALRGVEQRLLLAEAGWDTGESLDLGAFLQRGVEQIVRALEVDCAVVFTADEPGSVTLAARHGSFGAGQRPELGQAMPLAGQPALGAALRGREQRVLDAGDSSLNSLYGQLGDGTAGPTVVQPIVRRDRVLGILVAGNQFSGRTFEEGERRLFGRVAAQLGTAIENARLRSDIEIKTIRLEQLLPPGKRGRGSGEADLSRIVEETIRSFHDDLMHGRLLIDTEIDAALPPPVVDAARLGSIVDGLIGSGVRLTRPGGRIAIGAGLHEQASEQGGACCAVWLSSSSAVHEEQQQAWILAWERACSGDPVGEGGTDAGLTHLRALVEACGGSVRLDTTSGEASTLTVLLPVNARE